MLSRQAQSQKIYLLIGIVSLLPFLVVGFLRDLGTFEFIELKTLDAWLQWTAPRSSQIAPQIALITIDAKSEDELGAMPWRSHIYAALIHSLRQVDPIAIGLVAWFNREWEGEQKIPGEKLFVIRPYPKPTALDRHALPEVTDWYTLPDNLTQAQGWGFSHFPLSPSDGIYRSAQLVVKDRATDTYRYSFVMSILCQTYGIFPTSIKLREGFWSGKYLEFTPPAGEVVRIPINSQGQLFIRFAGDEEAFQPTSFVEALSMSGKGIDHDQFLQKFNDKCILIGITTPGVNKRATALGELAALALRANLLNGLLNRDFVWQLSRWGNLLYVACLAILSGAATILIYRGGHGYRSMLLFGSGLILCHLLFLGGMFVLFDLWIEVTGSTLALLLSGVIGSLFLAHLRLRHLLRQLQTTQDQLVRSEKEAVFGMMSARVRHELRNALNLIRAPAEMIRINFQKQDPLRLREQPEDIVSEMDQIIGWVTKLDEMIEDEFSFFQDSHMNFQQQALEPILKSALEMMQPVIDEHHIEVRLRLPPEIPPLLLDADKIRIVFTNLIKNACQAMLSGGILEVVVKVSISQQNQVTVIVKDTGTGIPADELHRIFEPFYTTKPRGLGLGLVNVKNIIEGHGGTVRVESEIGTGTTFFVRLQ